MNKKAIIIGGAIVVAGVAAYGIYRYYANQASKLSDMKFYPKGFNLQPNFDANIATLDLLVQLYNPTTFDATINKIYIDITVNGKKLGFVESDAAFYVPAKNYSDTITFSLTFSPKLLAADALQFALAYIQKGDYSIDFNGYVSLKSAIINKTQKIDYTTTLKQILAP